MYSKCRCRWRYSYRPEISSLKVEINQSLRVRGGGKKDYTFYYRYPDGRQLIEKEVTIAILFSIYYTAVCYRYNVEPVQIDLMDNLLMTDSEIYGPYQAEKARSDLDHWLAKHSDHWTPESAMKNRKIWINLVMSVRNMTGRTDLTVIRPTPGIERMLWNCWVAGSKEEAEQPSPPPSGAIKITRLLVKHSDTNHKHA